MASGDVIVFNGGSEARVLHSVEAIIPETAPLFLPELGKGHGRIGLQLRGVETQLQQKVPFELLS